MIPVASLAASNTSQLVLDERHRDDEFIRARHAQSLDRQQLSSTEVDDRAER